METISQRDRRTPFLKKENIIVKYKGETPPKKKIPVIPASTGNPVKPPVAVIHVKPFIKAIPENQTSSFWI